MKTIEQIKWMPWQWIRHGSPSDPVWETIIPIPTKPDYYWDRFSDGSGSLNKGTICVAQYDLVTSEYKLNGRWNDLPDFVDGFESLKSFLMEKLFDM